MRTRTQLCLLIFVTLFAGCTSGGPQSVVYTGTPTEAAPASPAEFDEFTGGIEGIVTSDEAIPVSNVTVVLVRVSQTVTDAEGRFSFSRVPPGTVDIVASTIGYETVVKKIVVEAGQAVQVALILPAVAKREPIEMTLHKRITIDYGAGYSLSTTHGGTGGRAEFQFDPAGDFGGLMLEVTWVPGTIASSRQMSIGVLIGTTNNTSGDARGWIVRNDNGSTPSNGDSPLRYIATKEQILWQFRNVSNDKTIAECGTPGFVCKVRADIRPSGQMAAGYGVAASLAQNFDFYLTSFWNQPLNRAFTALPDA